MVSAGATATAPARADEPPALVRLVAGLLAAEGDEARRPLLEAALRAAPAERVCADLKAQSERHLHIDPAAALRLAAALVQASDLAGRPEQRALGLMASGDALRALGRYAEAVAALDTAGERFLALGDTVGWARTRINWVWAAHYAGLGERVLTVAAQARDVLAGAGAWPRVAGLDLHTAWVLLQRGQLDEALERCTGALAVYESLGPAYALPAASVKQNTAGLLFQRGDFAGSLRLLEESRAVFASQGSTTELLRADYNIASVYLDQGRYAEALRRYGATRAALEQAGVEVDAARTAMNMVECYLQLNRTAEAVELAEETIARFARAGAPTEAAKVRVFCALATAREGDGERALSLLDEAGKAFAAGGLAAQSGLVLLQRAALHLEAGRHAAAWEEAERAHAILGECGLVVRQAHAATLAAQATLGLGEWAAAEQRARAALTVAEARGVDWLLPAGRHVLGRLAQQRGDLPAALDAYDAAIAAIRRLQRALPSELGSTFLQDKLPVYDDAIAASLRLGRPERAFAYLERAKFQTLATYLERHPAIQLGAEAGRHRALLAELEGLRAEHHALYDRLRGAGFARPAGGLAEPLGDEQVQGAIRQRERRIGHLLEQVALARGQPDPSAEREPPAEAPPRLDADTVLLEYYLRDGAAAVFVATTQGLAVEPLAARPADVRRLLRAWYLNLDATARAVAAGRPVDGLERNARGTLAALYDLLLRPLAGHLAGRGKLVVVPYGPLHAVPFHALHDGAAYLAERLEVAVAPSSRALRACSERPRRGCGRALVIANSDGGRLPGVLAEARAVAALLPGECYLEEAATRAALAAAPRYGVIHLAAHAEARLDNPTFAHLKLADGQLSTVDIFHLDMRGALVTLSACETGRSVVAAGDELIGLSRAFLYAGAGTLVQSLWRVEDGSAAALMAAFYRELCAGRGRGAALRHAQLALLRDGRQHPYFWAPFQLVGESGPV